MLRGKYGNSCRYTMPENIQKIGQRQRRPHGRQDRRRFHFQLLRHLLLHPVQELRTQGNKDEGNRTVLVNGFRHLTKRTKEKRKKKKRKSQRSCRKRGGSRKTKYGWSSKEHMRLWDSTKRRVDSIAEKMWQLNQSRETKTMNLFTGLGRFSCWVEGIRMVRRRRQSGSLDERV